MKSSIFLSYTSNPAAHGKEKGWYSFKSYVWSSIVAANLLMLAMAKLSGSLWLAGIN